MKYLYIETTGLEFTLLQWLPCSVIKTLTFLGGEKNLKNI